MIKRKKKVKKKKIRALVYTDQVFKTIAVRNKKTGKFTGRKKVKGFGDKTGVRRVSRGPRAGFIVGRSKPIKVRGSRKRGYMRRL